MADFQQNVGPTFASYCLRLALAFELEHGNGDSGKSIALSAHIVGPHSRMAFQNRLNNLATLDENKTI